MVQPMSEWERTLVLIKPDGVRRGLVGRVLARYEDKGLTIVAISMRQIDQSMSDQHYTEHRERDFYPELCEFITSGPLVAAVIGGDSAIDIVRGLHGATNGLVAAPGTVRGDFALPGTYNVVHASDSPESAAREIALWFPDVTETDS